MERCDQRWGTGRAVALAAGSFSIFALVGAVAFDYQRHGIEAIWYADLAPMAERAKAHRERNAAAARGQGLPWAREIAIVQSTARLEGPFPEGRVIVDRTDEHRPHIPTQVRVVSRYTQGWDFDAWGMPHEPVPIDAELTTVLHVPSGPPRSLRVDGTGTVDVLVNGQPLSSPLQAGANDLAIRWKAHWNTPTAGEAHLRFEWREPEGPWESIPRRAFLLPHGLSFSTLAWVLVLLAVAGATSALIYRAARAARRERRRNFYALALVAVGALALGYRLFDYPVAPSFTASDDELFATWNGWSLLHGEGPRGWSLWPHRYVGRAQTQIEPYYYFRTLPHFVISPYFEHPPGLHLLAGIAATLGGATHWSYAKFTHTRLVPIGLSLIAMVFMLLIGRELKLRRNAVLYGLLLYGALPILVLQHRMIKEEALLTPLALAAVWFSLRYCNRGKNMRDLVAAAILAGLAAWAKLPGAIFVPILAVLVFSAGGFRAAALTAVIGFATASTILLYGVAVDWDEFWFATTTQGTLRYAHFNSFEQFFDRALVAANHTGRGWMLLLWTSFLLSFRRRRFEPALTVPLIVYLMGIAVSERGVDLWLVRNAPVPIPLPRGWAIR